MMVSITARTERFEVDKGSGQWYVNICCVVNTHEIWVTVGLPFTMQKAKQALIQYCTYHKKDLGLGAIINFEPQTYDIKELDEL